MAFPQVRVNNAAAKDYIRAGQQLLFRLREMQRTSKVPILKKVTEVDDYTVITVQIAGGQEFIDIQHNPPPPPVEEEKEKVQIGYPIERCPPGFVMYKRKYIANSGWLPGGVNNPLYEPYINIDKEWDTGYVLGHGAISKQWKSIDADILLADVQPAPYGDISVYDCPTGGWYYMHKLTRDNNPYPSCNLITWYGNPENIFDDALWKGLDYLSKSTFWIEGRRYGGPNHIMGACIIDVNGYGLYYYILTIDTIYKGWRDQTNTPLIIYRAPVPANLADIQPDPNRQSYSPVWEEVASIDYHTEYALASYPEYWDIEDDGGYHFPLSTAHIDDTGTAFIPISTLCDTYTNHLENWGVHLLEIDLQSGNHSLKYSNYGDESLHLNQGDGYRQVIGESYVWSFGGLPDRYDVFYRIHQESTASSVEGGSGWSGFVSNQIVVKKNGEPYFTHDAAHFNDGGGSTRLPDGSYSTFPQSIAIYESWLLFFYPPAKDKTVVVSKTASVPTSPGGVTRTSWNLRSPTQDLNKVTTHVSVETGYDAWFVGNPLSNIENISLNPWGGASPPFIQPVSTTHGEYTLKGNKLGGPWGFFHCGAGCAENKATGGVMYNDISPPYVSWARWTTSPTISLNFQARDGRASYSVYNGRRYQHCATHFPEDPSKHDWSYICLLPIFHVFDNVQGAGGEFVNSRGFLRGVLEPDRDLLDGYYPYEDGQTVPFYIQSGGGYSWDSNYSDGSEIIGGGSDAWRLGYEVGDLVVYQGAVYRCIQFHKPFSTKTQSEPIVGTQWESYWEIRPIEVELYTNTSLTLEEIKEKTGAQDNWLVDVGII